MSNWYSEATQSIKAWCLEHGVDFAQACNVLAITSPRVQVKRNVSLTKAYLLTGSTSGLMQGVIKALQHYESTGEIRGNKTSAFARALQGDQDAVVLDTWMAKWFAIPQRVFRTGLYQVFEQQVRDYASERGLTPASAQAEIWEGINPTPQSLRF